ncbi:hypothetical protein GCM10009545_43420 [Saccharopolyspora thermophila]|uniref:Uncharacterized protein n=1 Tax=Saccharopolyspora thermophila TaxID=89367 RepID=A0ABN1D7C1_9PSEU
MSAVSYDVDAFGMLDSPEPVGARFEPPQSTGLDEVPTQPPAMSVNGDGNVTTYGNIDQSVTNLLQLIVGKDAADALARAHDREHNGRGLQDREALERLASRYVTPPGLLGEQRGSAFQVLHDRRVLLIAGEGSACGQFSAALRLGYELQEKHPELVVREELADTGFRLQAKTLLVAHEPAAVLVDLRGAGRDEIQNVRRGLVEFTDQLEQYRSYLILIIPHNLAPAFGESFPGRVHRLAKPSSVDVFVRHLTGVENPHELVEKSGVAQCVERLWPPKVKDLAEAVSDRINRGTDPDAALRAVLETESKDPTTTLRAEITRKQQAEDTEWLALLLAAGLLEGASAKHIAVAADTMLEHSNVAREQVIPLLRPSPFTRLHHLGDDYFDLETCELKPPGLGTQVLRHFWREHPDVHDTLLEWIRDLPRQIEDLNRKELERVADRVAELAAEGGADIAVSLADEWARTAAADRSDGAETSDHWKNRYRRSIAVRLLTTTALDASLGRSVRQKLWEWSRDGNADRKLLTAEVCAGIGQVFPRIALTRLKHLATSESETVRRAVLAAVLQIGGELGVSTFLRYMAEWFDDASPARLKILSESVASVLAERTSDIDSAAAVAFWDRALGSMAPDDLRPVAESWLRTAANLEPEERGALVEPLVAATRGDARRIAQLQYASSFGTLPDFTSIGDKRVADSVRHLRTRLDEVHPVWR